MLTREMNERLTRIGPGTPAGNLFRRYWQPCAAVAELQEQETLRVRLLGEDLVLYRDTSGNLGLVAEQCPHRRASLYYGVPEQNGIRCPYHGWLFDNKGNCMDQPAEPEGSTFKDRIKTPAYPVREMGGFFWAYMGPGEPPILPRHDYFVQPNTIRSIGRTDLPINWLQAMENSLDPTHSEWLHSWFGHYIRTSKTTGERGELPQNRHAKIGFDVFDYGIIKRRYYKGGSEEDNDWRIGHPVLFPNMLKASNTFQIRIPVDDENTRHYLYKTVSYPDVQAPVQDVVPLYEFPYLKPNGDCAVEITLQQDMMAWVTQGRIADRTAEHLGTSDRGILLYRQVLQDMISRVEDGEDPLGVFRGAEHDVDVNIPVDSMTPALTPSSMRALGHDRPDGETERRGHAAFLDLDVAEKKLRSGRNLFDPILEDMVRMKREHLSKANAQAAAAAKAGGDQ